MVDTVSAAMEEKGQHFTWFFFFLQNVSSQICQRFDVTYNKNVLAPVQYMELKPTVSSFNIDNSKKKKDTLEKREK